MMDERRDYQEVYEDYQKQQKSPSNKVLKSLGYKEIVIIAVLIGVIYYAIFVKKLLSNKEAVGALVVIGVIILILVLQAESKNKLLTAEQAKAILRKEFRRMQREGELPDGAIKATGEEILAKHQGKPTRWRIGMSIYDKNRILRIYEAQVEPYNGMVLAIKIKPFGFYAEEAVENTEFIMPRQLKWEMQYGRRRGGGGSFGGQ